MNRIDFLVRRDDLAKTELREVLCKPLINGQIRLTIDRFALTSNNISYAQAGDTLSYWTFFPAPMALVAFLSGALLQLWNRSLMKWP